MKRCLLFLFVLALAASGALAADNDEPAAAKSAGETTRSRVAFRVHRMRLRAFNAIVARGNFVSLDASGLDAVTGSLGEDIYDPKADEAERTRREIVVAGAYLMASLASGASWRQDNMRPLAFLPCGGGSADKDRDMEKAVPLVYEGRRYFIPHAMALCDPIQTEPEFWESGWGRDEQAPGTFLFAIDSELPFNYEDDYYLFGSPRRYWINPDAPIDIGDDTPLSNRGFGNYVLAGLILYVPKVPEPRVAYIHYNDPCPK